MTTCQICGQPLGGNHRAICDVCRPVDEMARLIERPPPLPDEPVHFVIWDGATELVVASGQARLVRLDGGMMRLEPTGENLP